MKEHRPNPEALLERVQEEERQEQRGKLKIYLGAAPGVGKTYAMLQDALAKRTQGLDVVVGVVESHGRNEILSMLKDIEILPKKAVEYRDKQLTEFDLGAALKRNPGLILMDEMAHTNVHGLMHPKRWQDIKELLDRGIDVYTTLNVQHIESLNDIVSQIIHAPIKETVPDSMLELADTIELVDLPPEDLLKRLNEGKVYFPAQAVIAKERFFRKGNLIALRELALRVMAELVNVQVLLYRQGLGIRHIWPTKEKILVCVGPGYESTKLIRTARRLATSLQAEWMAVYVETPNLQLSEDKHNSAISNLRLAEQLGADTRILTGFDVAKEIMNFAREQNVTQVVVWNRIRPYWRTWFFKSLADEIIRQSGEVDVYIVTGEREGAKIPKPVTTPEKNTISWKIYGVALGIVGISTLINLVLYPYLHGSNLIMVYLLGVTIIALFGRMGPSILASVLSVLAYGFLFTPPFFTFAITEIQYIFTLLVMLVVAQTISHLTILTRRHSEAARFAGQRTATLLSLSRQLASTRGVDKLLEIASRYAAEVFDSDVLILLPESGHLTIRASYGKEEKLNEKEQGVAQWVFDLGQMAGLGTDTLSFSDSIYVPLLASQGSIGVLRVKPIQSKHLFTPDQTHLLEACANQIALALEVDRLQDKMKKSELLSEGNRARRALLESVSHNLRTPLVAVMGAASTLMEMGSELDAAKIKKLGKNIYVELEQLNRLLNNLLQMTYLEGDEVKLQKQLCSLKDIINLVITTSSKKIGKKPINVHLPPNLPEIPLDKILIEEVFINLLDNAIKFTPANSPIEIIAQLEATQVVVSIEDCGPGIVMDEVNKLFEKFYRGRMLTSERGMGLGLAICRGIIRAHGGKIWAENCKEGGAAFRFTLPLSSTSN